MTATSQNGRILRLLKENKRYGVTNYQLSRISLNYTKRISQLRLDEGFNIVTERDHLKNGRACNTFRYFLVEEEDKPSLLDKFRRIVKV